MFNIKKLIKNTKLMIMTCVMSLIGCASLVIPCMYRSHVSMNNMAERVKMSVKNLKHSDHCLSLQNDRLLINFENGHITSIFDRKDNFAYLKKGEVISLGTGKNFKVSLNKKAKNTIDITFDKDEVQKKITVLLVKDSLYISGTKDISIEHLKKGDESMMIKNYQVDTLKLEKQSEILSSFSFVDYFKFNKGKDIITRSSSHFCEKDKQNLLGLERQHSYILVKGNANHLRRDFFTNRVKENILFNKEGIELIAIKNKPVNIQRNKLDGLRNWGFLGLRNISQNLYFLLYKFVHKIGVKGMVLYFILIVGITSPLVFYETKKNLEEYHKQEKLNSVYDSTELSKEQKRSYVRDIQIEYNRKQTFLSLIPPILNKILYFIHWKYVLYYISCEFLNKQFLWTSLGQLDTYFGANVFKFLQVSLNPLPIIIGCFSFVYLSLQTSEGENIWISHLLHSFAVMHFLRDTPVVATIFLLGLLVSHQILGYFFLNRLRS